MKKTGYTIIALYAIIIIVLGLATFIGQTHGIDYVSQQIYHSLWFCMLWCTLVVISVIYMAKRKLHKQFSLCLLHSSFIIILFGAAITFVFGKKGQIHLRQNETTKMYVDEDLHQHTFPFSITLNKFEIKLYPGTNTPSDFVSHLTFKEEKKTATQVIISMNNIYKFHGYRFYQSSFDNDKKGTLLSINHDPWGTGVTYFGYILLTVSMILTLFSRSSEFKKLLTLTSIKRGVLFFTLLISCQLFVTARNIPTINEDKAYKISRSQVIFNERIVPLNTVAIDFLEKIYGKKEYKGLTAEQVLIGWMLRPEIWKSEKMIRIKNYKLRKKLGIKTQYASLEELFDSKGQYRIISLVNESQNNSSITKPIRELDEKVGLILMLVNKTLFEPLKAEAPRLSDSRIEAEIAYNKIPFTRILFMTNLIMGIFTFLLFIFSITNESFHNTINKLFLISTIVLYLSFAISILNYSLRWYIGDRIPLSNGYETMLLLALIIMLITIFLHRHLVHTIPFGFILSGLALLVSHLGQMNPQITPLVPVLHSPLLSIHVSVIMASYALFAFMALNGICVCILAKRLNHNGNINKQIKMLTNTSRLMLYPAIFLLALGIFLGAVWANISWGAYWSWDPKETWALITLMVYAVAVHRQSIPFLNTDIYFHLYMIIAFLSVLMTYFGVNYFMAGMHSYA